MAFGKEGRGGGGRVQQASSLPGWTVAGLVVSCRGCKGDKVDLERGMAVMALHVSMYICSSCHHYGHKANSQCYWILNLGP